MHRDPVQDGRAVVRHDGQVPPAVPTGVASGRAWVLETLVGAVGASVHATASTALKAIADSAGSRVRRVVRWELGVEVRMVLSPSWVSG